MEVSVQFSPIELARLERRLNETGQAVGLTVQWLCWDQARLAALDGIKYVAPWSAGKPGSGKAQQQSGFQAIAYDLLGRKSGSSRRAKRLGIFDFYPENIDRTFISDGAVVNVTKDGRIYAKDETLYRPDASMAEMRTHHKKYQLKNGRTTQAGAFTRNIGRWKSTAKMMVKKANIDSYLKSVQSRVGSLKASWLPALEYYGAKSSGKSKASAWIAKQRREGGFTDAMKPDGNGSLVLISSAHHGQAIRKDTIEYIKKRRNQSMAKYTPKRIQQIVDQFNANRTNVQPIRQNAPE